jgi:uncharacterized cupredoxin-like copper-binding protein
MVGQSSGSGADSVIDVVASEFKFQPTDITAEEGLATFVVRNTGVIEHNFIIELPSRDAVARIPNIEVGKTEQVSVQLAPGSYVTVCTLPGHREAGMVGTLTVNVSTGVEQFEQVLSVQNPR